MLMYVEYVFMLKYAHIWIPISIRFLKFRTERDFKSPPIFTLWGQLSSTSRPLIPHQHPINHQHPNILLLNLAPRSTYSS